MISLYLQPEPDYDEIQGAWLTEGRPYAVIHRAAVKAAYRGRGLAAEMMQLAEDIALGRGYPSVRADTHRNNRTMRALLEKRGYVCCGEIRLSRATESDDRRLGYEKVF